MDPAAILITSSVIVMFLTLLSVSYKTGFVSYSIWSLTRSDQPKFEIEKSNIGKFVWISVGVLLLNIVYGLVIVRDTNEIAGIVILSLFNTVVIGYGLAFWVLLKRKEEK